MPSYCHTRRSLVEMGSEKWCSCMQKMSRKAGEDPGLASRESAEAIRMVDEEEKRAAPGPADRPGSDRAESENGIMKESGFDILDESNDEINICPYIEQPCEFWILTNYGGECMAVLDEHCPIKFEEHLKKSSIINNQ